MLADDFRLSVDVEVEPHAVDYSADGFAFAFVAEVGDGGRPYPAPDDRSGDRLGVSGIADFAGAALMIRTDVDDQANGGLMVGTLVLPGAEFVLRFVGDGFPTTAGVHLRAVFERSLEQPPAEVFDAGADADADAGFDAGPSSIRLRVSLLREGVAIDAHATLDVPVDTKLLGISASTGGRHSAQRVTRIERCIPRL